MSGGGTGSIRIATRASRLALWQAHHVAELLSSSAPACEVEIVHISTTGDREQSEPLTQFGGIGVFTREVQKAVLDGRADIAVHSLKDLPTEPVDGLNLAGVPKRGPSADVLVFPRDSQRANNVTTVADPSLLKEILILPTDARVGTGSPRRQAQLLHIRRDLKPQEIRGNVETRLRKLDEGQYDVLVLAEAGLIRLELGDRINVTLQPPAMYPAVSQGAIGIECRADDEQVRTALSHITDDGTINSVTAERSLLAALRAGCHAPLGVATEIDGDRLTLEAVVLSPDGTERIDARATELAVNAEELGEKVAELLKSQGADGLISPPLK